MRSINPFKVLQLPTGLVAALKNRPQALRRLAREHRKWLQTAYHPDLYPQYADISTSLNEAVQILEKEEEFQQAVEDYLLDAQIELGSSRSDKELLHGEIKIRDEKIAAFSKKVKKLENVVRRQQNQIGKMREQFIINAKHMTTLPSDEAIPLEETRNKLLVLNRQDSESERKRALLIGNGLEILRECGWHHQDGLKPSFDPHSDHIPWKREKSSNKKLQSEQPAIFSRLLGTVRPEIGRVLFPFWGTTMFENADKTKTPFSDKLAELAYQIYFCLVPNWPVISYSVSSRQIRIHSDYNLAECISGEWRMVTKITQRAKEKAEKISDSEMTALNSIFRLNLSTQIFWVPNPGAQ